MILRLTDSHWCLLSFWRTIHWKKGPDVKAGKAFQFKITETNSKLIQDSSQRENDLHQETQFIIKSHETCENDEAIFSRHCQTLPANQPPLSLLILLAPLEVGSSLPVSIIQGRLHYDTLSNLQFV